MDFSKKRYELIIEKWNEELSYLRNLEGVDKIGEEDLNERIEKIELHLENIVAQRDKKEVDYKKDLFEEIDKTIYKKQWHLLPIFHKAVKIKEYISKEYGEGELQNKIIYDLIKLIEDGKMNTKSSVVYIVKEQRIDSIPVLEIDLEKNEYKINVSKNNKK